MASQRWYQVSGAFFSVVYRLGTEKEALEGATGCAGDSTQM